jgi:CRISPR-associated protein Cmr4
MYQKAYGIIETLAPLHVGASSGEESGNLNLIFRDQFTQTGIISGSSIRGRFRSEMRIEQGQDAANQWYGNDDSDTTSESLVKFEYASIVWLPVFCPGQPVVWVSCPSLLRRYQRITGIPDTIPQTYTGSRKVEALNVGNKNMLFFNFGFLEIERTANLTSWFPSGQELPAIVVDDDEIAMIHDMALYRQSRVRLEENDKIVKPGNFFNTEALPEGTILVFAIALRNHPQDKKWQPFPDNIQEMYLGGLESIGFGHCKLTLQGV